MAQQREVLGGQELRLWVKAEKGRTWAKLADEVGVSYQSLRGWCVGKAAPEPHHRQVLHALTGVEPSVWATAKERAAQKAAAKRVEQIRAGAS